MKDIYREYKAICIVSYAEYSHLKQSIVKVPICSILHCQDIISQVGCLLICLRGSRNKLLHFGMVHEY